MMWEIDGLTSTMIRTIPINKLQADLETDEDGLDILAASIAHDGLCETLKVRRIKKGRYVIVDSNRRYWAIRKLLEQDFNNGWIAARRWFAMIAWDVADC